MLKESIHQREITILNVYKANDKALKHIQLELTILLKDNIKITEGCQEL